MIKSEILKSDRWMACFIIALIISLPFYSANVLAVVVQVDQNSGQDGFEGYLDGKGDVWTLKAAVNNLEGDLKPEDLVVILGGRAQPFDSCNSNDLGYSCEYLSDVSSGVPEDSYTFEVKHTPTNAGDGDTIVADSSAPEIKNVEIKQNPDGKVSLNFKVLDMPSFGVGLSKIEIIDADTQAVLQEITGFTERDVEFNYAVDYGTDGIFDVPSWLTGEGDKHIKIRAEDKFGHKNTKGPFRFKSDFIKPEIITDSLKFTGMGDFVGSTSVISSMEINITETSELRSLSAYSDQIEFAVNEIDPSACLLNHDDNIGDYYT
ncbi:MAG: hypothetical protein ABIH82_05945, partial [Candidatus Woesearchaeota archaeon]